jgi:hypothetical protein
MEKTFILYREIIVGDDLMECVYFSKDNCMAQPTEMKGLPALRVPLYQPSEEDKKEFCQSKDNFLACGRFKGYQQHLKALGLTK